jgi:hypothetical protein
VKSKLLDVCVLMLVLMPRVPIIEVSDANGSDNGGDHDQAVFATKETGLMMRQTDTGWNAMQ